MEIEVSISRDTKINHIKFDAQTKQIESGMYTY